MPFKPIDTHGSGPPAQYFEPDPATVEACAKIVDAAMKSKDLGARSPKLIASAIRSLVSGEPQNSAGASQASHRGTSAGESDPVVKQDRAPAGTEKWKRPDNIDAHPLRYDPRQSIIETVLFGRAIQKRLDGYLLEASLEILDRLDAQPSPSHPVAKQDCAPAGTVSALNSQYAGLEALLAAIHADDPKRELLVRVGDLMRENRALLSQFDVRRK